jgi:peptidoglycan/LPS O-acetylase OafA/YrhL
MIGGETLDQERHDHTDVPRDGFFQGFDGLRAIAALLVVVTHVSIVSGYDGRTLSPFFAQMDVGVPIFFVISGFLLYRPFVAARFAGRQPIGFGEFWKRRALRIFPAYWVCLVIVAYCMYFGDLPLNSVSAFFQHFFLLHVYNADRVIRGPVQQSWTLAVEVAFYAFLPIYAWCIRKVRVPRVPLLLVELAGVAGLYAFSVVYRSALLAANVTDAQFGQARTWLPGFLDQLALGMGLAVLSAHLAQHGQRDRNAPRWLAAVAWALAAGCFWIVAKTLDIPLNPVAHRTDSQFLLEQFFRGCVAALIVVPAVFAASKPGLIRRFLSARVMVGLGLISYGIYLWHEAWIDVYLNWRGLPFAGSDMLTLLAACLALTIPTAALSYYLIERPALKLKNRPLFPRRHRPATADQPT